MAMSRGLAALWFISLIFPLGSGTLSRGLFPTKVRRGQAEREERKEQEGNWKRKGRHHLQKFNDNEEERGREGGRKEKGKRFHPKRQAKCDS